jgi:hypothetical protein
MWETFINPENNEVHWKDTNTGEIKTVDPRTPQEIENDRQASLAGQNLMILKRLQD